MMQQDPGPGETPALLAAGQVAGAGAGPAETTVPLPRLGRLGLRSLPVPRVAFGPLAGRLALGTLILGALAIVLFATSGPSILVPRSIQVFPNWESGPLHGLIGRPVTSPRAMNLGFSAVVLVMLVAYGVVLASVRALSIRVIVIAILALHAILLMSPPLQLTDIFNYLGYARLGALHHLNPYTNVIRYELHDPVWRFTTWRNLHSPYGPLFTALTYPIALLPLPVAYWALKSMTVVLSLAFLALVWHCARKLGRDPRFALLFLAANPIYLMYEIAGFHNDFLLLLPSIGALALLLSRRDRLSGATMMLAGAVKFSGVLLLPFLLIAARPSSRRVRIIEGAAASAAALVGMSLLLFGFSLPNLSDQSTLINDFAFPNIVGWVIGFGGAARPLLRAGNVALVLAVIYLLRRRRSDWLANAGWATIALIASLAWLVPWYVVWVLPLAALASSLRLRQATVALTIYMVFAFIPATGLVLANSNINLMSGPPGQASSTLQKKLSQ